jgi:hypothetical protein
LRRKLRIDSHSLQLRYDEIVDILRVDTIWLYKRWAVKSLVAKGDVSQAGVPSRATKPVTVRAAENPYGADPGSLPQIAGSTFVNPP